MKDKSRGWLPYPVLSLLIAAMWLLLQHSLALPQLITAALLGLVLPRLLSGFLPQGSPLRRSAPPWRLGWALVRLVSTVLRDIVVSNFVVARLVLSPWRKPHPQWVVVPLALRGERAISLLATIITTTPGTVSCVVDEARHAILVHALDCEDAAALVAEIRTRYEAPLKEIFE
ncbi:Na+/H+ antiporter subunit E [Rivibacter subsaxonicus]|uniref:Multisubunit potassium/proton antiporter PhaE subunit n=1 Tax=Rivibacter subsaxonicus TaxID=457575 RepID=A0A4Q7VCP4_9BURK|nr:Na+/H+ antiporter subunit E [Rivibacter subsaxonicus]RZT93647.1 multisubunit potassium/proton antiporter PhaE subunit [Rivibacter subsaxonicus]